MALMMPMVTVWLSWNGLPTATTYSPTVARVESPQGRVGRPLRLDLHHRDVGDGVGADQRPASGGGGPAVVIVICCACSMTWLLVTMMPSAPTITPEPRLVLRSSWGMRKGESRPKNSRKKGSLKNGEPLGAVDLQGRDVHDGRAWPGARWR